MAWNDENIGPSVTGEVDAALVSLGQRGAIYLNASGTLPGGASGAGNFAAIQVISDAEFLIINFAGSTGDAQSASSDFRDMCDSTTSLGLPVIPAGTILYGPFTYVTIMSGSVIVYRA
jgi:hypothetical protein